MNDRSPRTDVISSMPIEKVPYVILKEQARKGDGQALVEVRRREKLAAGNNTEPQP